MSINPSDERARFLQSIRALNSQQRAALKALVLQMLSGTDRSEGPSFSPIFETGANGMPTPSRRATTDADLPAWMRAELAKPTMRAALTEGGGGSGSADVALPAWMRAELDKPTMTADPAARGRGPSQTVPLADWQQDMLNQPTMKKA